jgi:hypothetical protein
MVLPILHYFPPLLFVGFPRKVDKRKPLVHNMEEDLDDA